MNSKSAIPRLLIQIHRWMLLCGMREQDRRPRGTELFLGLRKQGRAASGSAVRCREPLFRVGKNRDERYSHECSIKGLTRCG